MHLFATLLVGTLVANAGDDPNTGASFRPIRASSSDSDGLEAETAAALAAMGYIDGYTTAPDLVGVTRSVAGKMQDGVSVYVSGHGQEAVLVDIDGRELHKWSYKLDKWPWNNAIGNAPVKDWWRHFQLYEDGGIVVIYENQGLVRLDKDSKLLWKTSNLAHHHVEIADDGTIVVLTRRKEDHPQYNSAPLEVDYIAYLSADGKTLREISILDALLASDQYKGMWLDSGRSDPDIFHTNSLFLVGDAMARRLPGVSKGDVLLSLRHLNAVAIVNPASEKVVWAATGDFRMQHDADELANGDLLVFDNLHKGITASSVEAYDPTTMSQTWIFAGSEGEPFFTRNSGRQQRLDNGNTLLVETENGRVIEVDKAGQVVWEFYNPNRAGDNDELIAAIYDMQRYPRSYVSGWLK